MDETDLRLLLEGVSHQKMSIDQAIDQLNALPYESINGYAKIDTHRAIRTGLPEVIYAQGKSPDQVAQIFNHLRQHENRVLATRVSQEMYQEIREQVPDAVYHPIGRILSTKLPDDPLHPSGILILSAGTSDIPVAEEAALTIEVMGYQTDRIYDVGVSGLHRLLSYLSEIQKARVIIVVAGMEGALPSVVGGLVSAPLIAVPTSVGYGASFQGLSALLGMLNSCASGVAVMNIDNGFGAGCLALKIIHQMERDWK